VSTYGSTRPRPGKGPGAIGVRNKFPGSCHACNRRLAAGDGWLFGKGPVGWLLECEACRAIDRMFASLFGGETFIPARPTVPACMIRLGVEPPYDEAKIKGKFRELAMVHHPDKGGDPDDFVQLRLDYERALQLVGGGR
jgi:hypothetical protein